MYYIDSYLSVAIDMIDMENIDKKISSALGVVQNGGFPVPGHRSPCQFGRLPPRSSPSAEPKSMGKFQGIAGVS
jgi:hypothetical protein